MVIVVAITLSEIHYTYSDSTHEILSVGGAYVAWISFIR